MIAIKKFKNKYKLVRIKRDINQRQTCAMSVSICCEKTRKTDKLAKRNHVVSQLTDIPFPPAICLVNVYTYKFENFYRFAFKMH